MRREAAVEPHVPGSRDRSDLFGVTFVAAMGVMMLVWVGALVWAAIAFFTWLVS